jgi:pilus assembly protein CpaB
LYLGQTTGQSIEEGTMVLVSDFQVEDVSNTLASKIPVGERAMALAVNNIAGVSGLLKPGDRVDILGTFPVGTKTELIQDGRGGESVGYVTMTLLQNVSLLATGQKISSAKSKGNRRQGGYSAVTLSVTIEEAELLTIAQTRGKMSLLLRHREDVDITSIQKKTLREVLEQLEVIQEQRQVRNKTPSRRRSMQRQPKPCPEGQTRQKDGSCKVQIEIIDGSR